MFGVAHCQTYDYEVKCSRDTITLNGTVNMIDDKEPTGYYYKVIQCETRSTIGFRLEAGGAAYRYNVYTASWLGNHISPSFSAICLLDKFNLGFRFKPWSAQPRYNRSVGNKTLTTSDDLTIIKLDFYLGYSIDTKSNISFEPYFGYSRSIFEAENKSQSFKIPSADGLLAGVTLNKYWNLKDFGYFALFTTGGYSWVDFSETSSGLDKGYFECTVGIAFKKYFIHRFQQRV